MIVTSLVVISVMMSYIGVMQVTNKIGMEHIYRTAFNLKKKELENSVKLIIEQVDLYGRHLLEEIKSDLSTIKYEIMLELINENYTEKQLCDFIEDVSVHYPEYEFTIWDESQNELKALFVMGQSMSVSIDLDEYLMELGPSDLYKDESSGYLIFIKLTKEFKSEMTEEGIGNVNRILNRFNANFNLIQLSGNSEDSIEDYFKRLILSTYIDNQFSFFEEVKQEEKITILHDIKKSFIENGEYFNICKGDGCSGEYLIYGLVHESLKWGIISSTPVFSLMDGTIESINQYYHDMKNLLTLALGVTGLTILISFISGALLIRHSKTKEITIEKQRAQMVLDHNEIILSKYERINEIAHDIKNHLICIKGLIGLNEFDSAIEYIDEMYGDFNQLSQTVITGNRLVDVILNEKLTRMKKSNIKFKKHIENVTLDFIEDKDLVILLTNLLDNAIESCERSDEKFINFQIYTFNGSYLVVKVINSCTKEPLVDKKRLISQKRDLDVHGYGIKNLERVTKFYNGMTMWEYDSDTFQFQFIITIPLPS